MELYVAVVQFRASRNTATAAASVGSSSFCWCVRVCLWVNTLPICVKCEAKQASGPAAWNVLSRSWKADSAVFWLGYLGWAGNSPWGAGVGWNVTKAPSRSLLGVWNLHSSLSHQVFASMGPLWHCTRALSLWCSGKDNCGIRWVTRSRTRELQCCCISYCLEAQAASPVPGCSLALVWVFIWMEWLIQGSFGIWLFGDICVWFLQWRVAWAVEPESWVQIPMVLCDSWVTLAMLLNLSDLQSLWFQQRTIIFNLGISLRLNEVKPISW